MISVQRDYILRVIEQLAQFLVAALGIRQSSGASHALVMIEQQIVRLAEVDSMATFLHSAADEIRPQAQVDANTDDSRIIFGVLLEAAAEIYDSSGALETASCYRTVALRHLDANSEAKAKLHVAIMLIEQTEETNRLAVSTVMSLLWQYYERIGMFAQAEDWLFRALEASSSEPAMFKRGMDFYLRLLRHTDENLILGGLPREEVFSGLAELRSYESNNE